MLEGMIRCCNCINYQYYKIMIDPLVLNSRKSSFITNAGSSELQQKVVTLEQQIDKLNKIIIEKDQMFNNIRLAFDAAKFKHNQLSIAIDYQLMQSQTDQKHCRDIDPMFMIKETSEIKRLTEIVFKDLERILDVRCDNQSCARQTDKILSIVKGLTQEREQNGNFLEQNQNKRIYQVPIQMAVFKDLAQSNVQADFSPFRSYVYEVPIQFYSIQEIPIELGKQEIDANQVIQIQRRHYEVPIQMSQIQEIPGLLSEFYQLPCSQTNNIQSEIQILEVLKQNHLIQENERLYNQIAKLSQQISVLKQQLSLQKQKITIVEVPVRVIQLIETPIELEPFQVNYVRQSISIQQAQTQTEFYQQFRDSLIQKQFILQEIPIEVVIQKIIQVPKETVRQEIVEITKIQFIQVPTQVLIQKQVLVQIQKLIPVFVPLIKQVPIEVQIESQPLQIQKIVPIYVPIIKEIPIEVEVEVQIEVIKQVKKLVEVPVIVFLQAEKSPLNSLYAQKQEVVSVEQDQRSFSDSKSKLVQRYDCQPSSNNQIECLNTFISQYQILQLPLQIYLQKTVEVQKIVEKIVEKQIMVEKIIQVPVQQIVEIQKKEQSQKVAIDTMVQTEVQIAIQSAEQNYIYYEQEDCQQQKVGTIYLETNENGYYEEVNSQNIEQPCQANKYQIGIQTELQVIEQSRSEKEVLIEKVVEVVEKIVEVQSIVEREVIKYIIIQIPVQCIIENPAHVSQDVGSSLQNRGNFQKSQQSMPQEQIQKSMGIDLKNDSSLQQQTQQISNNRQELVAKYVMIVETKEQQIQTVQPQTTSIAANTQPLLPSISILELPIELELIENEIRQRQEQIKHQEQLKYIQQKYQSEMVQLNGFIQQMQKMVNQKQTENQSLQQNLMMLSLKIQEIQSKHLNQIQVYQKQAQQQSQNVENLSIQNRQKESIIQKLERQLMNRKDVREAATLYQSPPQFHEEKDCINRSLQTQELDLFNYIQFIEVPNIIEDAQEIFFQQQQNHQDQLLLDQLVQPLTDQVSCNLKQIQLEILQAQEALTRNLIHQINPVSNQIFNEMIQTSERQELDHEATQHCTYQAQVYEIPIMINVLVSSADAQVQTEFKQVKQIQHCIYEVPVELLQMAQYQLVQYERQNITFVDQQEKITMVKKLNFENAYQVTIIPFIPEIDPLQIRSDFNKKDKQDRSQRIYEIPLEMEIINQQQVPLQLIPISIQTESKMLQIIKQVQINEIFTLAKESKSAAPLKFSIFNDLENIAINPVLEHRLARQAPRERQKELQNQILRLGSDITVNFQNNSQVQSMTPGGLFASHSSYEKFPTPQINNISVIKKDSFYEGKFFGSLDIRQEILSREDPIASLRMANKKLAGFQQESSDGDSHNNSRQMIIEQNETIVSKDINRMQTPNLQPHDLNFSQYAKFQEHKYHIEQEHHNYIEQNQILNTKITQLQKEIQDYKEEINKLENNLSQIQQHYKNTIQRLENDVNIAQNEKEALELKIQEYKNVIQEKQYARCQLQKHNQFVSQNYQKLRQQAERNEREAHQQLQRLQNLVLQKQNEAKDAKIEILNLKNLYDQQINQLNEYLISNKEQIQKMYEQLQQKNQKIDQLQNTIEQLRKSINLMKHLQNDTSEIYEQQFQKIRCEFEEQKRQKQDIIEQLRVQIQRVNTQILNEQNKNREHQEIIDQLQRNLHQLKLQKTRLHEMKNQVEDNYIGYVKQLKDQIQRMKYQISEKQQLIQQLQSMQVKVEREQTKIQYIQVLVEKNNHKNLAQLQQYCQNLQSIILKYEKKLFSNYKVIEELQQKVCEYLNDALEKQQQAENLYLKIISYENKINEHLLEKVELQLQNKKQAKSIQEAEKKLKFLGMKLVELARQRAQYDSCEDDEFQV